jgi:hypothetical protein
MNGIELGAEARARIRKEISLKEKTYRKATDRLQPKILRQRSQVRFFTSAHLSFGVKRLGRI